MVKNFAPLRLCALALKKKRHKGTKHGKKLCALAPLRLCVKKHLSDESPEQLRHINLFPNHIFQR